MNVIVTGASKGIGRGIAEVLAENGHRVGILGRNEDALRSISEGLNNSGAIAHYAVCDIRKTDQVVQAIDSLAEKLGGIEALINNAGTVVRKSINEITIKEWHTIIDTNLNGLFYATKASLPYLTSHSTSSIVNLSSVSGRVPLPGGSAYAASKYAVTGFSESIFAELRDQGVRVSTVFPGSVETDQSLLEGYSDWKVTPREVGKAVKEIIESRAEVCVSRVEIRPAKAPKK
jgi:NADP-dependent 3-hydroxy acid dehydrogenase YdfG